MIVRHKAVVLGTVAILSLLVSVGQALGAQPEQRTTELVSQLPQGTQDTGVCGAQHHGCEIKVTPDGRHVFFAINQGPLYERTGDQTTLISTGPHGPDSVGTSCYPYSAPCEYRVSDDGRAAAWTTGGDIYVRKDGVTRLVSTIHPPVDDPHAYRIYLAGMSNDGNHVFYYAQGLLSKRSPLFEWTPQGVTQFPAEASTPAPDAYIYAQGGSRDGRRVFFGTSASLLPGDANGQDDIYERTPDGQIKLISADNSGHAGGGYLDWVSADGSQAIFGTAASLVPEDTDTNSDLYERSGDKLMLLAPGGFLAASNDGTRVFFETDDSLSPLDTDPGAGDVYERVNGETKMISTSSLLPNSRIQALFAYPNGITPDGTHVFFETDERFVAEDTDSCHRYTDAPDGCLDLYESVGDSVSLVSTGPASTNANYESGSFLAVSPDGQRAIFASSEPLVAGDHDTCFNAYGPLGCEDIYQRLNGTTTLLSSGPTDDQGNCKDLPEFGCPSFVGASPDAQTVYFQTRESLTPDDTDGGLNDVYVSKVLPPGCQPKSNGKSPKKCTP